MFTNQDTDRPKMPQPGRMHLPILAEAVLDELSEDSDPKHEMVNNSRAMNVITIANRRIG